MLRGPLRPLLHLIVPSAPPPVMADVAGATAIEYAFVALLVSIAGIGAYQSIGISIAGFFGQVANSF